MRYSANRIIPLVSAHILLNGGIFNEWYVGITKDIEGRVYGFHKVRREDIDTIILEATSKEEAKKAETELLKIRGVDGEEGGGDPESVFVYCYKKNPHTRER